MIFLKTIGSESSRTFGKYYKLECITFGYEESISSNCQRPRGVNKKLLKVPGIEQKTMTTFQYIIDFNGRDQVINVRKKSQRLVALVNDKERIAEVREKAAANRDK